VNSSTAAKELFGFAPSEVKALCTIKHSITRYRITVEAFRIGAPSIGSARRINVAAFLHQWLPISKLHKLSFPSAHKRILKALVTSPEGTE
jgi:hypothetical protein